MQAQKTNVTPPPSVLSRLHVIGSWDYQHPEVSVRTRVGAALFDLSLGLILVTHGYWIGAVPLVAAVLLLWSGKRVQRSMQSVQN